MRTVCGLDVHKDSVFACILHENGEKIERVYDVLTPSLEILREDLLQAAVSEVSLESTSIYWVPILRVLGPFFKIHLANPQFIKQMPGRKSDQGDANWIATLTLYGFIRKSYVPNEITQQLRIFHRRYTDLRKRLVWLSAKIDNQVQRCNIRISNYMSNLNRSKSYEKVIDLLSQGEFSPGMLLECIHCRIKKKHGEEVLLSALKGNVTTADVFIFQQLKAEKEFCLKQQQACLDQMKELVDMYYPEEFSFLLTLPGMGEVNALGVIAEIGADMSAFDTASKLVGWAGLKPRNDESAGKVKSRKTLKGNKYLRMALVQTAWGAIRTKDSWFGAKYASYMHRRMPAQKALIAIARKILVVIWHMLSEKQAYDPLKYLSRPRVANTTQAGN